MMTAYRKAPERPNLVLTRSWVDPHICRQRSASSALKPFQAAVSKARELGWIV